MDETTLYTKIKDIRTRIRKCNTEMWSLKDELKTVFREFQEICTHLMVTEFDTAGGPSTTCCGKCGYTR